MVDIHLLGTTVDSTLLFQVVGIILTLIIIGFAYLNYHKKPASTSNVSQSVSNSSGIVQQNDLIIKNQTIMFPVTKDGWVSESTKLKLNEIDTQLKDLYLPMDNYIRDYIITVSTTSNDTHFLDMTKKELENKLGELRTKYPGRVDKQVIQFSDQFFKDICIPELFRDAVGIKIRSLQKERDDLMIELKEKGQ